MRAWAYACAPVALLIQHARNARAPYCIVICGLWLHHIIRHYVINDTVFGKKLFNIKCVSRFSLQLLSKTFLILRRMQQDIVINVKTSSCKVPVIFVGFKSYMNFLDTFSKKYWSVKFHQNPSSGSQVVPCGRTDGRRDMKKLVVAFRSGTVASPECFPTVASLRSRRRYSDFEPQNAFQPMCTPTWFILYGLY